MYKQLITVALLGALSLCVQGDLPLQPTAPPTTEKPTAPPTTLPPTTAPPTTSPPTTSPPSPPTPPPTTPAPVTTTSAPPSDKKRGNWTVSENNVTCIMVQMVISTKISYPMSNEKNGTVDIHVPWNAKPSGSCAKDSQSVDIAWDANKISIIFGMNSTAKTYFISNISLTILADSKTFPNISEKWVNKNLMLERNSIEFNTNVNQSYRCSREQDLPLYMHDFADSILVLSEVQLQAFHKDAPAVFGEAQDCELDTPDIVPIAVGCALAGLVLVVLVAYLIGRRRSQARGYLSM